MELLSLNKVFHRNLNFPIHIQYFVVAKHIFFEVELNEEFFLKDCSYMVIFTCIISKIC